MGLTSSRLLYLACTLVLAALAFAPDARASRTLDLLLSPLRVLGELASPIGWLATGEARAAERGLGESAPEEYADSRKLAEDERLFALPDEEPLIGGRRFVHAQVVQRLREAPDRVECVLEDAAIDEIVPDLPVVLSNSYVGRVWSVDPASRRILVHLVTDKGFRVGARLLAAPATTGGEPGATGATGAAMVVGGLEARSGAGTPLAVHNPDRPGDLAGDVIVDEGLDPRAPFPALCDGFHLGRLSRDDRGRLSIEPEIDYADGLFRVVVVLPPSEQAAPSNAAVDVFAASNWRETRVFAASDPASWREGLKVDLARTAGVREGAALVAGARLVGFVARAGALSSDVALLGDPGTSVPAQARIDGEVEPRVLGRLHALGRAGRGGRLRFQWTPSQPLAPGADGASTRKARLFTGAGALGVPRGLVIGEAELPCGRGPHVIEIQERVDPRLLRRLWVWRESDPAAGSATP